MDWLTFATFLPDPEERATVFDPDEEAPYIHVDERPRNTVLSDLAPFIKCLRERSKVRAEPTHPRKYFRAAWQLKPLIIDPETGELKEAAPVAWVGLHGSGRWVVDINGDSCPAWDMTKLAAALEKDHAVITRCDLAADDFEGRLGVAYALRLHHAGDFITNGRNPKKRYIEGEDGSRSVYIGRKINGKVLNVYEKGIESKSLEHPNWVRWELRLGNKDRVIPYAALSSPAAYFLGAFHVLPEIFPKLTDATPEHIATKAREKAARTMAESLANARRSYGPIVHQCASLGMAPDAIVNALSRPPKDLIAFLDAEQCRAALAGAAEG